MRPPLDVRLPAPAAGCRTSVCLPARDEARTIGATLAALAAQRAIDGSGSAVDAFEIIVFANNCRDATADVVRGFAARTPHLTVHVVEATLAPPDAHIGAARKFALDLAATRFLALGKPDAIVASLDADTVPDERWIAWIEREIVGRDAVAGFVTVDEAEQERLLAPVRLLYARELTYRRLVAEIETLIDPRPEDPAPRHASFVGASFAVRAECYIAAGGLPPLQRLEDLAFARALRRIDARVRHSPFVRATTSARPTARVTGGFGTFMAELHACARRATSFTVEHPQRTLDDLESRAALRRLRNGAPRPGDVQRVATIFGLPPHVWLPGITPDMPLGELHERLARAAHGARNAYPPVPVEVAIEALRARTESAKLFRQTTLADDRSAVTLDAS